MKKLIISATLALVGAAAFSSSAMAQDFTNGDLILSFRLNTNTGSDLEVDLGSPTNFTQSFSSNNVFSTLGADLTTVFGSNWNTNASLVWSVVGVTNGTAPSGANDLFISDPNNATTITASNPAAGSGPTGAIGNIYTASATDSTALGNGAFEVALGSSDGATYSSVITNYNSVYGTPYAANYGFATYNTESGVSSTGNSIEELYLQTPAKSHPTVAATSTNEGDFVLEPNGTLEFNPVATPEPSTYALFGLGALALVFARRRFLKA